MFILRRSARKTVMANATAAMAMPRARSPLSSNIWLSKFSSHTVPICVYAWFRTSVYSSTTGMYCSWMIRSASALPASVRSAICSIMLSLTLALFTISVSNCLSRVVSPSYSLHSCSTAARISETFWFTISDLCVYSCWSVVSTMSSISFSASWSFTLISCTVVTATKSSS